MDQTIKKDIISVLKQTVFLCDKRDFIALKELSNHVIHNASIVQDQDSIQVAVIVFALSKILDRASEVNNQLIRLVKKSVQTAANNLIKNNEYMYRTEIKKVFKEISNKDKRLFLYIQNVIEKANIVKGSDIYRHGISMGRVSEILGINQWELMSYIGKTRIADEEEKIPRISERLSFTKKLFRIP